MSEFLEQIALAQGQAFSEGRKFERERIFKLIKGLECGRVTCSCSNSELCATFASLLKKLKESE